MTSHSGCVCFFWEFRVKCSLRAWCSYCDICLFIIRSDAIVLSASLQRLRKFLLVFIKAVQQSYCLYIFKCLVLHESVVLVAMAALDRSVAKHRPSSELTHAIEITLLRSDFKNNVLNCYAT